MSRPTSSPVVHLELHTGEAAGAAAFYELLCGWRPQRIETCCGSYQALGLGEGIGGGLVECGIAHPLWLPYVEVPELSAVTDRARSIGARILLEPREGPRGWRSVVSSPAAGEVAFWQPKS